MGLVGYVGLEGVWKLVIFVVSGICIDDRYYSFVLFVWGFNVWRGLEVGFFSGLLDDFRGMVISCGRRIIFLLFCSEDSRGYSFGFVEVFCRF